MTLFTLLDYASVLVFALTGALVASRAQLDIVGFFFFACLTAVGGGTLRDVLLDRNPVFWIADPAYLAVACAAAVLVFFTAHRFESRYRVLLWLDACALGIAVAAGSGVAAALGHSVAVVLVMGMITGCMGGLMRDVVSNEVPLIRFRNVTKRFGTFTAIEDIATLVGGSSSADGTMTLRVKQESDGMRFYNEDKETGKVTSTLMEPISNKRATDYMERFRQDTIVVNRPTERSQRERDLP